MPRTKNTTLKKNPSEEKNESKIQCIKCGSANQANFYVTKDNFRGYFKKIPYCKNCVREIYKYYLKKYNNNMNLAIYYMCRKIDVPYIHSNYEGAINNINNPDSKIKGEDEIVSAYFKGFGFSEQNGWGFTFDDSQGENQIEGLASYDEFTKVKRMKKKVDKDIDEDKYEIIEYDTDDLKQKWGNFPNDVLSYLESEYLDWNDKLNGITDKSTEIMVKEVCLQCNEIRMDRESGINVEKKLATLQNLLKNSGLIEQQNNITENQSVGMVIEDIESKRPIKEVDPDFKDVDNISNIIYGFVGAMCRAAGKENVYTEKFDEIYGKYSIDIIDDLQKKQSEDIDLSKDGVDNGNK